MKYLIAIFFFMSLAASMAEAADEFLAPEQAERVLRAIDNRCGDTWCEGDYGFSFDEIRCSARARGCVVLIEMTPYTGDTRDLECVVDATSYQDLVIEGVGWITLQETPYHQLTDCIAESQERP